MTKRNQKNNILNYKIKKLFSNITHKKIHCLLLAVIFIASNETRKNPQKIKM